ncbi:hypothetical protein, partial [Akkermansia sp.]|uniref:hypothetical protein n=1 Tax=Akkermansia sp. TaxID=1872421 RepID=UPI001B41941C
NTCRGHKIPSKHTVGHILTIPVFRFLSFRRTRNKNSGSSKNKTATHKIAEYFTQEENDFCFSIHAVSLQLFKPFIFHVPITWKGHGFPRSFNRYPMAVGDF